MSECPDSPDGMHHWIVSGKAHRKRTKTIRGGIKGEIPRRVEQLEVEERQVCEYCEIDRFNYVDVEI